MSIKMDLKSLFFILPFTAIFCFIQEVQSASIMWASFPVEMEAFFVEKSGEYRTDGKFNGIGMMYFSPERKLIKFDGIIKIGIGFMGQEENDKYQIKQESFTIQSIIPISGGEYAFEGVNRGLFNRRITGKINIKIGESGYMGTVEEFQMSEHGQENTGVMNRYHLPTSSESQTMLKKYDEIFFGGNWVAITP